MPTIGDSLHFVSASAHSCVRPLSVCVSLDSIVEVAKLVVKSMRITADAPRRRLAFRAMAGNFLRSIIMARSAIGRIMIDVRESDAQRATADAVIQMILKRGR